MSEAFQAFVMLGYLVKFSARLCMGFTLFRATNRSHD